MRIGQTVTFPGRKLARDAQERWLALGGDARALRGNDKVQRTIAVSDESSADGQRLQNVVAQLSPAARKKLTISRGATFELNECENADLLMLGLETIYEVSIPQDRCSICNKIRLGHLPVLREGAVHVDTFDAGGHWIVSRGLAESLRQFIGAHLVDVSSDSKGAFWAVTPKRSIGLPVDSTWSAPCPNCGQRGRTNPTDIITGLYVYDRTAWQGDEIVGVEEPWGFIAIAPKVWRELTLTKWKKAGNALYVTPLVLRERDRESPIDRKEP
jgi:hypothetical protein